MDSQSTFPSSRDASHHVLLVATLSSLSVPFFLSPVLTAATTTAKDRLTVVLFSPLFNSYTSVESDSELSHTRQWHYVQKVLTYIYVQTSKVAHDMDKVLLQVDVLLKGINEEIPEAATASVEEIFRVEGDCIAGSIPVSAMDIPTRYVTPGAPPPERETSYPPESDEENLPPLFPVVALGGTFDHLHAGHKVLLSMAAWIARDKLIVGVTDDNLLKSKSHSRLLESIETRMKHVTEFLKLFRPTLKEYQVVPITDVYGPTAVDDNIQALVVSEETRGGAETIAKYRAEHSLSPLRTFVIDVISPTEVALSNADAELLKTMKMSSTFIRQWIDSRMQ